MTQPSPVKSLYLSFVALSAFLAPDYLYLGTVEKSANKTFSTAAVGRLGKETQVFTEKRHKKSVMLLLGIDLGSSSVKASVIDGESGNCLATAFYPSDEMQIISVRPGWAEQDTEMWWTNLMAAISDCTARLGTRKK